MKRAPALTFLILLAVSPVTAQQIQEHPAVEGFVTRAAAPSDFDVNAIRIMCDEKTSSGWSNSDTSFSGCPKKTPRLGEYVTIFGTLDKDRNLLEASRIFEHPLPFGEVSGSAVIDASPIRNAPGEPAGTIMVRADGYWIVLPFNADITLWGGMQSVEQVDANTWIEYKGKMRSDGVVVASRVKLIANVLNRRDERFRTKLRYDPASATTAPTQSSLSIAMTGVDVKRIPPSSDQASQDRVERIGNRLIPSYQKQLPNTDPTKLNFHFVVVDRNVGEFPVPLPDGTILVPHSMVRRVPDDSQLAVLLADAVASLLERQKLRTETAVRMISGGESVTSAAYVLLGGTVGLAAWAADERVHLREEMKQSNRVSLVLLHDAGYDIDQAPLVWWALSTDKPINETQPPGQAAELYRLLATVWSHPQPPVAAIP
jgi:hypothetical protein